MKKISQHNIKRALYGYKPLFYYENKMVFYHNCGLWIFSDDKPVHIVNLLEKSWKDCNRYLIRLFRHEPRFAVPVQGNHVAIALWDRILLIDLSKKKIHSIWETRKGFSSPLHCCKGKTQWLLIWGDYGSNSKKEKVNIYGMKNDLSVEVIYSFPPNTTRHVHNVIPMNDGGYYILTGDHEKLSGIYHSDDNFKEVRPIKTGEQQYRAVVGFDTPKGLLYATDAVNETNYIYLLSLDGTLTRICKLNGSCIYGTYHNGNYYFATSVEPDDSNRGFTSWLSYKLGKGILTNEATLVKLNGSFNSTTLLRLKKDIFPMKLFQFGTIQFPCNSGEYLWVYPVAVKPFDRTAIIIDETAPCNR